MIGWFWRKLYGEEYAPPCRLPDYHGPGWRVTSLESGHVDLILYGARILEPLAPSVAYVLSTHIRDHSLALGGIVHLPPEDIERRERLRREQRGRDRALPEGTLWP